MRQYFESWFLLFLYRGVFDTDLFVPLLLSSVMYPRSLEDKAGVDRAERKEAVRILIFFFHILWMWENREQLWCRSELAEFYYRVTKAEGETLGTAEGEWEGEVERTMKSNGDECGHIVSSNSSWEIASDASCSPRSFPTQGLPVR